MACFKQTLKEIGLLVPDVMLPKEEIDLKKWAVVACDQFTSDREYWEDVKNFVGGAPSTLKITFPEVYLDDDGQDERIKNINEEMKKYEQSNFFKTYPETLILVKRETRSGTRWGIIVALDLEKYSWEKGAKTLIRATEGTILSRIPPRKKIRENASLELPHILVLISDKKRKVIEQFVKAEGKLKQIYSTSLMKDGGKITGYELSTKGELEAFTSAIKNLYDEEKGDDKLLFAMGDGNHSFATAKSLWEDIKIKLSDKEKEDHPARYCLVEIENIFDEGIKFEAIHRCFFGLSKEIFEQYLKNECSSFKVDNLDSSSNIEELLKNKYQPQGFFSKLFKKNNSKNHCFITEDKNGKYLYTLNGAKASIEAGTLQNIIDKVTKETDTKVDYIHGIEQTSKLAKENGNLGVFLPSISKDTFFESIKKDGALPRKTFSMGEDREKRYYIEARKIK